MIGLICGISNALVIVLISIYEVPREEALMVGAVLGMAIGMFLGLLIPGSQIFESRNAETLETLVKVVLVGAFAVAAFALMTFGVGRCPSVLLSLISTAECITSFAAQISFFKEPVNVLHMIGVAIVLTALIAATLIDRKIKVHQEGYDHIKEDCLADP